MYLHPFYVGLAVDENTKDSVGSDNYSGGSGNMNEDSNMSFPGDENSQDTDMKAGEKMSHITKHEKTCLRGCKHVRHKCACLATETR